MRIKEYVHIIIIIVGKKTKVIASSTCHARAAPMAPMPRLGPPIEHLLNFTGYPGFPGASRGSSLTF